MTIRGLRVVTELIRLRPLPFTVSVIGAAVFAASTVASTIILGRVTDDVVLETFDTGEIPDDALAWAVAAVAALTVLRVVGVVARRYFAAMTSEQVQMWFRNRLSDQYLGQPLSWHQQFPTGQLLAHADNDTEITADVLHPLPFSLGAGFLAVFSAISLLVVEPLMALVAVIIFGALVFLNRIYSSRVERPAASVQAGVGRVSSIAHESFDGALVVKTLGRAEAENERFAAAAHELQGHRMRVGFIRSGFEAALDALPALGIVAVVVIGSARVDAGAMTLGELVQVASLFTILSLPMRVFGFFLEMVPPSVVARERIRKVLAEPFPPTDRETDTAPVPRPPAIEARAVAYSYPTASSRGDLGDGMSGASANNGSNAGPVLAGVDLRVEPGEVVAIVGSTGSGKSTLCNLLAGLVEPTAGAVLLGDRPLAAIDAAARAEAVGVVFQESFLFADTVRANITLGDERLERAVADAAAIARVDAFADELSVGLETELGERGVTLSGGQRQRVALARALVRRPPLLILDDATSAVDPVIEQEILANLRQRDGEPTTTVIVAQRVSTIELADRVLYLSGGRIAAAGPHLELLATNPGYEALVRAYESAAS